ncbi:sugar ABC transporter substrate-binding protein [Sorangium cellulosum]|uniref:Sugar ABC transporter substrate-binding protein n=1 Tax=Sorangium cellulosum TaxID=56 RepID=A0A2L0EMR1_SORCE|nr:sugar ABC transporter substrate-binding protein [Sorangium cellulosum]AUX40579.1 sugar ABC transporter substrate-binding protein [Sorangium cellulosum]
MKSRILDAVAACALLALGTAACGKSGGDAPSASPGSSAQGAQGARGAPAAEAVTLTYWASNQAPSVEDDRKILQPELDKFEKQTGIKVKLEVISWSDLLNRILAATSSGKGPDVLNIGNSWSASLQATGAFLPFDDAALAKIGGKDRFVATTLSATGAAGQPPAAVPLYGLAYGLFYNKKMFADAGIEKPPANWGEFITVAKKLTDAKGGRYGVAIMGASYSENAHFAFMFGRQHGAAIFEGKQPRFDAPEMVAGVKQYIDLLSVHKVVNPSNAEYVNDTQMLKEFTSGKAAMLMIQSYAQAAIEQNGMARDAYGVAPVPMPDPLPAGGKAVNSHVAGINIAVFEESKNRDAALKFVAFMTSPEEQKILNGAFGSLPVVSEAYADERFKSANTQVFQKVLAETAESMPMIEETAQFETLVGTAMRDLLAEAASGKAVTDASIRGKLTAANQQMASGK